MKKFLLILLALCFVFAGNFESFAQKRTTVKKPVKRKLVKCRVNGKIVFRTRCRVSKVTNPEITVQNPEFVIRERYNPTGQTSGMGSGGGMGDGRGMGNGSGMSYGTGSGNGNTEETQQRTPVVRQQNTFTSDVKILAKPKPNYTDAARKDQVQGKVVLRVTFLANGKIGPISVISGLGNGLTEQAINAAKAIKFEPAKRNGKPYKVVKIMEYSFTIY